MRQRIHGAGARWSVLDSTWVGYHPTAQVTVQRMGHAELRRGGRVPDRPPQCILSPTLRTLQADGYALSGQSVKMGIADDPSPERSLETLPFLSP